MRAAWKSESKAETKNKFPPPKERWKFAINYMPRYKIFHFKSLASTQDKAKEFSKNGVSNIVIVSDTQTRGRGRFKRRWVSGKGGLWMSILLKLKNAENMQYLTFAAAVSVVNSISKIAKLKTNIKWPNDVNYKGKKLCGILTEGIFGKENYAIVGIGLNVNQDKFPEEIRHTAISLKMIKGEKFNKRLFLKKISDEFFHLYNDCYNKNRLDSILKFWKEHCDTINKDVAVITKIKKIHGKAVGVDKNCNLLLKLKNGKIIKIIEGDINVRY